MPEPSVNRAKRIVGFRRRVADRLMPWVARHATAWPSQHATHEVLMGQLREATMALQHIAEHGTARPLPPYPDEGEPCRRPPEDCAADALGRL